MTPQHLGGGRIQIELVIGKLKVYAILCQPDGKRRRGLWLGFNLMAAVYNLELKLKSWLIPGVYYRNLSHDRQIKPSNSTFRWQLQYNTNDIHYGVSFFSGGYVTIRIKPPRSLMPPI